MDYRVATLKNGLRVVTIHRPSRMITAARVYVRAGSRYDGQHSGKAHFVEHILFAGTANRSSHQLYSDIECIGGMIQANTTKEYTTFYTVVMDRYLETGLDVLADIIINPVFNPVTFLKEKLVIAEEIKQSQDTQSVLWDRFAETLWVENPIRQPTLGDAKSLQRLEYEDVLDFYRERYTARNMVVSICGCLDHRHAVEQISQGFSHLQSGDELRPLPVVEPPPSKKVAHIEKDTHQTHLIIGVQATDMKDENRYAVKLMDRILGSGASSRLCRRLREDEKLAYTAYSVAAMYEDAGCFAVYTACSPENVPAVESLVLEEWEKLKTEPVSDAELEKVKRIYEGTLARECETNLYVAAIFGIEALLYEIEPFAESIKKIKSVTKQDIMEAADRYLNTSKYAMVTVGRGK